MSDTAQQLEFDVRVEDGNTVLQFETTAAASVIVQSASGEEIYLPSEETSEPDGTPSSYEPASDDSDGPQSSYEPASDDSDGPQSSYQPASDDNDGPQSSYQPASDDNDGPQSSYQPASDDSDGPQSSYESASEAEIESTRPVGRMSTPSGFVVVHPEPVTDVRVVTAQ